MRICNLALTIHRKDAKVAKNCSIIVEIEISWISLTGTMSTVNVIMPNVSKSEKTTWIRGLLPFPFHSRIR